MENRAPYFERPDENRTTCLSQYFKDEEEKIKLEKGLVTIRNRKINGDVELKVYAQCGGEHAESFAWLIRELDTLDMELIHKKALERGFGCRECLYTVRMDTFVRNGYYYPSDELDGIYLSGFDNPWYNPFLENGDVFHFQLVEPKMDE